jgi:hypothetical protein
MTVRRISPFRFTRVQCTDKVTANWFDHSRDLLYIVNVFRDQMTRPIVGVAYSMGFAQLLETQAQRSLPTYLANYTLVPFSH